MAETHFFDIHIAELYGVNCAVILQNIWHWIRKNEANGMNYYDGHYWTYNSTKAFKELFPYLSQKQIETALKKLRDEDILITGNYNAVKYDRTLWYAITPKGKSILLTGEMEKTEKENGNSNEGEPIPYNKPKSKTSNKKPIEKKKEENTHALFDRLYIDYKFSNALIEKMREWVTYKVERKEEYKEQGMKSLLRQVENKCKEYGDTAICALIDDCMANNWKGIIFDRLKPADKNKSYDTDEFFEAAVVASWERMKEDEQKTAGNNESVRKRAEALRRELSNNT